MPELRHAQPQDAAFFAGLHAASFPRGWSAQEFSELLAEDHVFGFAYATEAFILLRQAADEVEIATFAVAQPLRGRGVGQALLTRAMEAAQGRGAVVLHLDVAFDNDAALGLYLKNGFEAVGERKQYYSDGKDAVAMKLVLSR